MRYQQTKATNYAAISEALAAGLAQHQAGQYQQAEITYQQVLALAPTSTETLHLLGLLALQMEQPVRAGAYLDRAIALEDTNPVLFTTRATVYRVLGISSKRLHLTVKLSAWPQTKPKPITI